MAESLNDFFVNIGTSIEAKIPKAKESFSKYLKNSNDKSNFLSPCTPIETMLIIKDMKSSKACGPNHAHYKRYEIIKSLWTKSCSL